MQQAGGAWRWERYTRASSAASGIEVGNAILLQKSQECRPLYYIIDLPDGTYYIF